MSLIRYIDLCRKKALAWGNITKYLAKYAKKHRIFNSEIISKIYLYEKFELKPALCSRNKHNK